MFHEDILDENSKAYKKAYLTFSLLQDDNCTPELFKMLMKKFVREWNKQYYMPADVYQMYINLPDYQLPSGLKRKDLEGL